MSHHAYTMNAGSIDPNAINYASSYQNNYGIGGHHNSANTFSSGAALIDDDDLLDGLSPTDPPSGLTGQDFNGINGVNHNYGQEIYSSHHNSIPMNQAHINGYSNTPDGDPIQSPFMHNFNQYRGVPQSFGGALQTQGSYASSPLANGAIAGDANDQKYMKARMTQAMQRNPSNQRSPLPSKTVAMSLPMNPNEGFPIRTNGPRHEKSHSGQFMQTPNSMQSFSTGPFSSPVNAAHMHNAQQVNDMILKNGAMSMPSKIPPTPPAQLSTQDAKRKKRRESHNLVERRRRDNINERIQDLSKLVPGHRLEDEKIRKAIQNGTPLSPSLNGIPSPAQATSALAGPGARRATSTGMAGNITTGLPLDEKDKGPNKGDILNGAVSWTRDLMWMLHLKIQQQEELMNIILDLGGTVPFEISDDERRMQTELVDAMARNEAGTSNGRPNTFSYSRTAGTGLRVPSHTDYKGEPLDANGHPTDHISISPDADGHGGVGNDMLDPEFLDYEDDGSGDLNFKEEDEYVMDLTQ
jgi:hypothetical protein